MKYFFLPALICFTFTGANGQPADSLNHHYFNVEETEILRQTEGYLRSSFRYTTAVNIMVIGGGTLVCLDMIDGSQEGLTFIGFEAGFGGVEMSKSSPIALVKATRGFIQLRDAWPDRESYERIMSSIRLAGTLCKISVTCTFLGEGLLLIGFLQQDETLRNVLIGAGIAAGCTALGTSIGTTVETQKARIELGRSAGSIEFSTGVSGVGAVYRLPHF